MTTKMDVSDALASIGINIPAKPALDATETLSEGDEHRYLAREALNHLDPRIEPAGAKLDPHTGRIWPTLFPTGYAHGATLVLWRRGGELSFIINRVDGSAVYGKFVQPFVAEDQLFYKDRNSETQAFYDEVGITIVMQEENRLVASNDVTSSKACMSPVWTSSDCAGLPLRHTMVSLFWKHSPNWSSPSSILIQDGSDCYTVALDNASRKSENSPQFSGKLVKVAA